MDHGAHHIQVVSTTSTAASSLERRGRLPWRRRGNFLTGDAAHLGTLVDRAEGQAGAGRCGRVDDHLWLRTACVIFPSRLCAATRRRGSIAQCVRVADPEEVAAR
jgi:hypothetical protein